MSTKPEITFEYLTYANEDGDLYSVTVERTVFVFTKNAGESRSNAKVRFKVSGVENFRELEDEPGALLIEETGDIIRPVRR